MSSIESINYDYAVWTQTYNFVKNKSKGYVEDNFGDDTFVGLKLDGVFIFQEDLVPVFAKGFDHQNSKELEFTFYDFDIFPNNKKIFPSRLGNSEVAKSSGLLNTKYGPALYSVTEIKKTDKTGDKRGFVLFLRLFSDSVITDIKKFTHTEVFVSPIKENHQPLNIDSWIEEVRNVQISPISQLYINDFQNKPLFLLSNGSLKWRGSTSNR